MRTLSAPRAALAALRASLIGALALAGLALVPAYADSGGITFSVVKAGFVIGGSAGSGMLFFHGQQYPLGIGGLSYGFTFGASETHFRGTVSHIRGPGDVAGVYAAGNVGAAVGAGAQAIVLTNEKGAVLTLTGSSVGAIVSGVEVKPTCSIPGRNAITRRPLSSPWTSAVGTRCAMRCMTRSRRGSPSPTTRSEA